MSRKSILSTIAKRYYKGRNFSRNTAVAERGLFRPTAFAGALPSIYALYVGASLFVGKSQKKTLGKEIQSYANKLLPAHPLAIDGYLGPTSQAKISDLSPSDLHLHLRESGHTDFLSNVVDSSGVYFLDYTDNLVEEAPLIKQLPKTVALTGAPIRITPYVMRLLDLISKGEGTSLKRAQQAGYTSVYDITLGYGRYLSDNPQLTTMTIKEIYRLQAQMLRNGAPSTAVGRYQYIRSTLKDRVRQMGLSTNVLFDKNVQDAMALQSLQLKGLTKYLKSGRTRSDKYRFVRKLAAEWASIEDPKTGRSRYNQPVGTSAVSIYKIV